MLPETPTEKRIYQRLDEKQRLAFYYDGASAVWDVLTDEEKRGLQREWEAERDAWEESHRCELRDYFAGY